MSIDAAVGDNYPRRTIYPNVYWTAAMDTRSVTPLRPVSYASVRSALGELCVEIMHAPVSCICFRVLQDTFSQVDSFCALQVTIWISFLMKYGAEHQSFGLNMFAQTYCFGECMRFSPKIQPAREEAKWSMVTVPAGPLRGESL